MLTEYIKDSIEFKGKVYDLSTPLNDENITITGKGQLADKLNVGYITLEDLILSDDRVPLNFLLKNGLFPEMLNKDWQHIYGVGLSNKGEDKNKILLVVLDRTFLLEKFAREWVLPLGLTTTMITTLSKEVKEYASNAHKREKERKNRELARLIVAQNPGTSMEDALNALKALQS